MKPTFIILLCIQLSTCSLYAQNLSGKWYEIENPTEALYLEYHFGKKAGEEYLKGLSNKMGNVIPMITE